MNFKKALIVRYLLQFISLVSFVWFLATLSYPPGQESLFLHWISRFDPWLLLSQLRWQREIPPWVWLPLLTLASTILWGRIFCGWLCPFGALLALTDKVGRTIFKKMSRTRTERLYAAQPMRGFWLLFLGIIFVLGSNWILFLTPFALFNHEIVRVFQGQVPLLLIGIMTGTLLLSRLWCSVLCPTGALLSMAGQLRFFGYQLEGNCVQCKKCTRACPVGTTPENTGTAQAGCLSCGDCQRTCPTKAISWQRKFWRRENTQIAANEDVAATQRQTSRRQFFKAAFVVTMAAALWSQTVWAAKKTLRPPGALTEVDFTAVCNRCGRCVQVCPAKALYPMPITEGLANFETPYIIPRKNRCDLCLACQDVCPTGAIAQVPLGKIRMGRAVIDKPRCIAWNGGKMCYICGEQCPVLAIQANEHHQPSVIQDKCVGCGSCENACPIDGEAAIRVFPN